MLYTIMPEEVIFKEAYSDEKQKYEEIEYNGKKVIAKILENGDYVIERLISTDVSDYVNENLMPGNIISKK